MLLGHFRHVGRVYVAIRRRRLAPHLVKQVKPVRQVYAADASHRT